MKKMQLLIVVLSIALYSCHLKPSSQSSVPLNDTIETPSGLKYFYVKKGDGPKIEKGSKVGTYLSLKVDDKVVWNTDDSPDSLFTFVADYSRLIKGFTEMTLLLREGDEVVAILPHTIAYGEKGAGDIIPPKAILVYDQFKVVNVEAPKLFLSDTLYSVISSEGLDATLNCYDKITQSVDAEQYHTDEEQLVRVWYQLNADSLYQQAADYGIKMGEKVQSFDLKMKAVESLEVMGANEEALALIKAMLEEDPENSALLKKRQMLESENALEAK